jgi:preprotein translocase subunit SecB
MNQTQRETLAKVASQFTLQEVQPIHLEAALDQANIGSEAEIVPEVDIALQTARKPTSPRTDFAAIFRFDVTLQTREESSTAVARIRYHVIAVYSSSESPDFEDEQLQLFAQTNGMVHVWPYLRAFVQSSCASLGIPAITLPPFRVGQTIAQLWQQLEEPKASVDS